MLIQFSVENFRSIKNRAVLSMEASADKTHPQNIVKEGKDAILKVVTIFGANGAGKSNIFLALTAAILAVRHSNIRQVGEPFVNMVPFKFDEESSEKPSAFEFVFKAGDNKKYVYGFSAYTSKIIKEYLYVYNSARPTTIFERDENAEEKYKFTNAALRKELMPVTLRNTENKLFLATATEWNCESTRPAFEFFATGINTHSTNYQQTLATVGPLLEADEDDSLKKFINNMLKEADISIDDFEFSAEEQPIEQILAKMPPELRGIIPAKPGMINKEYKINTLHVVKNGDKKYIYTVPINDESEGTRCLFAISPILKKAFESGEVICVDEMDKSLHPALLQHIVNLFNDPDINKAGAQFIISSHATSLLSQEYLRRDQIYFVDKNGNTGESELYSLDEFSPRKREDIRKAYLLGRYGAMPNINDEWYLKNKNI